MTEPLPDNATRDQKLDYVATTLSEFTGEMVELGFKIGLCVPSKEKLEVYLTSTDNLISEDDITSESDLVVLLMAARTTARALIAFTRTMEDGYEAVKQKFPDHAAIQFSEGGG